MNIATNEMDFQKNHDEIQSQLEKNRNLILIAGGGTAGHVNPALAIGQELRKRYPEIQLLFLGSPTGPEKELVEREGFLFYWIDASPFETRNLSFIYNGFKSLFRGIKQCDELLRKYRVIATVGTGGYVSAPLMQAARKRRVPRILHEQNAYPGKATRVMSKDAEVVCVSLPDTVDNFPLAKRVVLTGNPIAEKFFQNYRKDAREELGIGDKERYVLVSGGSLGALTINNAIVDLVSLLKISPSSTPYKIHLVTGRKYHQEFRDKLKDMSSLVKVSDYIFDMPQEMAAADIVIGRAGAGSIFELSAMGKPSILIPYPHAKGDHQYKNAQSLVKAGAAVLVSDQDVSGERLKNILDDLFLHEDKLSYMAKQASTLAKSDAAAKIVDEIIRVVGMN